MTQSDAHIWGIIIVLGICTYLIRLSFLGLIGDRPLPPWVLRHLRYTAVAVIPALIAPMVIWPQGTDGEPDPARLAAAAVTLAVGYMTKNVLYAVAAGLGTLYGVLTLLG